MTSPYPGYYQASDGQWYPVPAAAAAPPPPAAPALPPGYGPPPPAAGYAAPPAPPEPVGARGTLEDMVDQPSAGGGTAHSKFFTPARMQGHWIQVRIPRDLNANDVEQQRDKNNRLLTFASTGKPKFQLKVPAQILSTSDPASQATIFDDGRATIYLKGVPFDAFKEAMAAAGIADPAKAVALGKLGGAEFYMVSAGTKQFGSGNPANMFTFTYTPNGRELDGSAATVDPTPGPASVPTPGPVTSAPAPTAPAAPGPRQDLLRPCRRASAAPPRRRS